MAAIIDTCPSHNNHKKRISTMLKAAPLQDTRPNLWMVSPSSCRLIETENSMRLQVSLDRLGLTRELQPRLEEHAIGNLRGIELDTEWFYLSAFSRNWVLSICSEAVAGSAHPRGSGCEADATLYALRQEHHEVQALLKTLPDLIFTMDLRGRIQHVDEAVLNILHLTVRSWWGCSSPPL